jgi:uncharacterized membrane protein
VDWEAWMAAGEIHSPIVSAIQAAEKKMSGEIRVHLCKDRWDRDPSLRARRLFSAFGMSRTSTRNAVLIYVNFRNRCFSILADKAAQSALDAEFWRMLSVELTENLVSTQSEHAISRCVSRLGQELARHFPAAVI